MILATLRYQVRRFAASAIFGSNPNVVRARWDELPGSPGARLMPQISESASVRDFARVEDQARVSGFAQIGGYAVLGGSAHVSGDSIVLDFAYVGGTAEITGRAQVCDDAYVMSNEDIAWVDRVGDYGPLTLHRTVCGWQINFSYRPVVRGRTVWEVCHETLRRAELDFDCSTVEAGLAPIMVALDYVSAAVRDTFDEDSPATDARRSSAQGG